jgi:hypothetical protein
MQRKKIILAILAGAIFMSGEALWAAQQDPVKEKIQTQTKDQERIYGSEMMTEKERNEYRERMRKAKTEQDREKIREKRASRAHAGTRQGARRENSRRAAGKGRRHGTRRWEGARCWGHGTRRGRGKGRRTKALTDTDIEPGRLALPAVPGRNWHASEGDL